MGRLVCGTAQYQGLKGYKLHLIVVFEIES